MIFVKCLLADILNMSFTAPFCDTNFVCVILCKLCAYSVLISTVA